MEVGETLQELARLASDGAVVVVEGRRDVISLSKLGINGRFFVLVNGNRMIENIGELEKEQEIVLLVDFDRRGKELVAFCERHLGRRKNIHLNTEIWRKLKNLIGKYVKDVEGLVAYLGSEREP